jgi:hypothetical protein
VESIASRRSFLCAVAAVLLLATIGAQAQWVMVARAVSGQVQRMSNKSKDGAGYDVATVILLAPPDKVYQTALASLKKNHPEIMINSSDDKKHEIKFSKGDQVASMQANKLGDKMTQLVVASNLGAQVDPTPLVVQGVLKVCEQMNVTCTMADQ